MLRCSPAVEVIAINLLAQAGSMVTPLLEGRFTSFEGNRSTAILATALLLACTVFSVNPTRSGPSTLLFSGWPTWGYSRENTKSEGQS